MPGNGAGGYPKVLSKWVSGALEFFNRSSGQVIAELDPATNTLIIPSGATLDVSLATVTSALGIGWGTPYTAGVQGATANVIDVTLPNQFWAVDSGTGATNAVTPSAAPASGRLLKLTYAATTGTVTMTFGAGFKPSATLAVTVNHFATVLFESDGTNLREIWRSAIIAS